MAREMNFEQDLRIDEMALDMEWLDHPTRFFQYGSALAEARRERERAKQNLLVARTELRKALLAAGEKVTESVVDERAASLPEHAAYAEACYTEDRLDATVRSMNVKKDALENLVKLLGMQYFCGPKEPRDLRHEVSSRAEMDRRVGGALNPKGKKK
jgi:hypothetical protein